MLIKTKQTKTQPTVSVRSDWKSTLGKKDFSQLRRGPWKLRERRMKDRFKMKNSFCGQRVSLNWVTWLQGMCSRSRSSIRGEATTE